ncbi:hypothetical protein QE369_002083 [Agrobacterium larrymoorei]|uniref:Lipoprotein n=1 Tax=Agrobacterium larrymoorei TaxID=160699 RepID=A0AAJ2BFA7_9HYPH|nr:hypothetical protein [Agrobacterium larrymoorei]
MKPKLILFALMLGVLSSCQSVPAERKNSCACLWERMDGISNLGAIS